MSDDAGLWTCPNCEYTATAEAVRENGGCLVHGCEWKVPADD